jgi:CubicO group peptidase (beta-lactamase class C family)
MSLTMPTHSSLSMRFLTISLIAGLLAVGLQDPSGPAMAQPSIQASSEGPSNPDATPVEERIRSYVDAFNRLSPESWAQAEQLVRTHFADSTLEGRDRRGRIEFLLRDRDLTGGYTVEAIDADGPTTATVQLTENGAWGGQPKIRIEVQGDAPHKITAFNYVSFPDYSSMGSNDGDETSSSLSEAEMVRRARQILDRGAEEDAVSGTVLVGRNGRPLLVEAYGLANRTYGVPNRIETRFSIASTSKMFTAVAIAQLVADGKVALDDKLAEYVPDLPTPEAAQKIEIRHLLSHTSGMGGLVRKMMQNPEAAPIDLLRGDSLRFEPGTRASYSNGGFIMLGEVIETVTDTTYEGYLDEHVFGPAGMTDTYIRRPGNVHPQVATGYRKQYAETGTRFHRANIGGLSGNPAGSANSTVLDLLRFATALQQGTLVDPAVLRTFTSVQSKIAGGRRGYGYGFEVAEDGTVYGHGGNFEGVETGMDIYRESGFVVIVLSNRQETRIRPRVTGTMRGLIQRVR